MLNLDTTIWKYSNVDSFLNQYINGTIGFTQLAEYQDYYEGKLKDISFFEKLYFGGKNRQSSDKEREETLKSFERLINRHFASCWTLSENEDFALWKSFSDSTGGVAIKTTIGRFLDSLLQKIVPDHDKVIYKPFYKRSFCKDLFQIKDYLYTKYEFYTYEKEYRFILDSDKIDVKLKKNKKRINIPIDYSKMINKLFLSPYMNEEKSILLLESIKTLDPELFKRTHHSVVKLKDYR